jgi:spore germination protein GerM
MKRPSRRLWLILGAAGLVLAVAVFFVLRGLREPQPLRYRLDLTERGAAVAPVTVYYLAADSLALVPAPRHVLGEGSRRQMAEELVSYLSEDTDTERAPLPPGTRVIHFFETGDGEAVVDLNARFQDVRAEGIREERMRLSALVRTLAENLDGVERIRILVHGRPLDRWGEHLEPGPVLEVDAW